MSISKRKLSTIALLVFLAGASGCEMTAQLQEDLDKAGKVLKEVGTTITGINEALNGLKVNGITFDATNATITVDGVQVSLADIKQGMRVVINGLVRSDGTGVASRVAYTDELEGVVNLNEVVTNNRLIIMGQTVYVSPLTVFESQIPGYNGVADLLEGNTVEVSGFSSGNGEIWSTRIELKSAVFTPGTVIELKGNITNLTPAVFNIGNLVVDYQRASLDDYFQGALAEGLFVEVKSSQGLNAEGVLLADVIEVETEGVKSISYSITDDEVDVQGAVTAVVSRTEISLNGSKVKLTDSTRFEGGSFDQLQAGSLIKVDGYVNADGEYVATEIELGVKLTHDSVADGEGESESESASVS